MRHWITSFRFVAGTPVIARPARFGSATRSVLWRAGNFARIGHPFTAPTSNSGFKAPSAILKADFNLEAERDFTPVFSGKHDNSVLGVANKDYDAASIANEVMKRMIERKVVDPAKIRSIYKSETFPTTGYGYAHNLDPKLVEKVKEAFFTFPWAGSALKAEFKEEDRFVPITYKKDWSVIRKIDAATGVKYTCK